MKSPLGEVLYASGFLTESDQHCSVYEPVFSLCTSFVAVLHVEDVFMLGFY